MADNTLSRIMTAKGYTIKSLGEVSGVSWRTIEGYHQGRRNIKRAPYSILVAMAKALDVEPEELLD